MRTVLFTLTAVSWIHKSFKSWIKYSIGPRQVSLSFLSGERRDGRRKAGREKWKGRHNGKTAFENYSHRCTEVYLAMAQQLFLLNKIICYHTWKFRQYFFTSTHSDTFFNCFIFGKQNKKPLKKLFEQQNNNLQVWFINIRKVFSNWQHQQFHITQGFHIID